MQISLTATLLRLFMNVSPRAENGGVMIKPASLYKAGMTPVPCMRGQGQGWFVLRASKQSREVQVVRNPGQ